MSLSLESARESLLETFEQERLIAVVRTETAEDALWTASVMVDAGLRLIEIPWTVPDTPYVIEKLCETYPQAIIGAGTVIEARHAVNSLAAGAQFLVSPVLEEALVRFGSEQDILVLPGIMTPTEIYRAMGWGASAVKFFPAEAGGGADFVKSVKGPMPEVKIIPTGGIKLENAAAYLKAGALAIGVGGPMMPDAVIASRDAVQLQTNVQAYLSAVSGFRGPGVGQEQAPRSV